MRNYSTIGIQVPDLLIPNPSIDLTKWAVIACDQFTSQPEYWQKVRRAVNQFPSTLHLILPEVYLGTSEEPAIISEINQNMRNYITENIIISAEGMVLVERATSTGIRHGLVLALDLEKYDYRKSAASLIRATEGTILERLPPRIRIRENAILELPHILVLIDDPEKTVIEPLWEMKTNLPCIYDFDLMLSSGHIQGFLINDAKIEQSVMFNLEKFIQPDNFKNKYQISSEFAPFLYAVGDGNHSLATAKAVWEKKKGYLPTNHPLRYALVEVENIHDSGLVFEPIHRVLFGVKDDIQKALRFFFKNLDINSCETISEMKSLVNKSVPQKQCVGLISLNSISVITIENPDCQLPTGSVQAFLDEFLESKGAERIDFIHGDDAILEIGQKPGNIGFYLPAMQKSDLFKTVILEGALPRKTFSMGEAKDKRFYLECRQIQEL